MLAASAGHLAAWCVLVAGLAAVAGCGFKPLYGEVPGSVATETLASVEIGLIPDRPGQLLRNRLLTRLHPSGGGVAPIYRLDVELRESSLGLAVRRDETATRTNLTITADVVLTHLAEDEIVFVDRVSSYSSYDILDAEFATLSAERDARERAIRDLGDRIATQVALYLQRSR